MKRCLAALLLLIMTMMMNCGLGRAEETVFPADTPFADRAAEEAHLRANRAVHDRYLFEPDLYVCAMTVQKNGDRLFEYRWQYSPTAIFSVNVAKDSESLYDECLKVQLAHCRRRGQGIRIVAAELVRAARHQYHRALGLNARAP